MSYGITEDELRSIRAAHEEFMPDTLRVYTKTSLGDGEWDYQPDHETRGRISNVFGQWREVTDRQQGVTFAVIVVPWDQEVKAGDRIYSAYGRQFEVRDVKDAETFQTAKQCLCEGIEDAVSI